MMIHTVIARADTWENHSPVELDGWTQIGRVGGFLYGTWFKKMGKAHATITTGKSGGNYWLQIGNCMFGEHETPHKAAEVFEKVKNL